MLTRDGENQVVGALLRLQWPQKMSERPVAQPLQPRKLSITSA
jgi:hypothetical protein